MTIRELKPSDVGQYRPLRIQALGEWPPAFGSPAEEEEAKSTEEVELSLVSTKDKILFGAFVDDELIGTVRYSRYSGSNEGHRAYIAGFYVDPVYRGRGIGRALLEKSMDESSNDKTIRRLNLTVVSAQTTAIRLYESLGFNECGRDYETFSARGQFFDEILMTKPV